MINTQIHLVRHGEVHNPHKILYGRLPRFKLSTRGQQQARRAGDRLNNKPIAAVFSSPLLRARQTATEILNHHPQLDLHISTLLNEVYTLYEGRPGAEIDARDGDLYSGADACFEQPADIVARVRRFLARMRTHYPGKQVVAVTHGDIITFAVLWAKGFDLTPQNKTRLLKAGYPVAYPATASITTLSFKTGAAEEVPNIAYIGS